MFAFEVDHPRGKAVHFRTQGLALAFVRGVLGLDHGAAAHDGVGLLGGRAEADGNDVIDLTKVKSEAPPPAEPSPSIAASRPKRAAARKK